jgi:ssDNA-binding Zn-finger/Zn-ribbon topoisomerase 1
MSERMISFYQPDKVGIECPECHQYVWISSVELRQNRSSDSDETIAYRNCPRCYKERQTRESFIQGRVQRIRHSYPDWSPVIGPHVALAGEMYGGER